MGKSAETSPHTNGSARKPGAEYKRASEDSDFQEEEGLSTSVGRNLFELRSRSGLSLEKLSAISGVSRSMLSLIEKGKSVPTINVLWRISRAMNVSFSSLLTAEENKTAQILKLEDAKFLSSGDGKFVSRALFPFDTHKSAEFYELKIAPGYTEKAVAHPPGTLENLVIIEGKLDVSVGRKLFRLEKGDSFFFEADVAHSYHNPGKITSFFYLVMTYSKSLTDPDRTAERNGRNFGG